MLGLPAMSDRYMLCLSVCLLDLLAIVFWLVGGFVVSCGRHIPRFMVVGVFVFFVGIGFVLLFLCVMLVLVVVVTGAIG